MSISVNSQGSEMFSMKSVANINDLAGKTPEPKKPEAVEFAKMEVKAPETPKVEIKKPEPVKVEPKEVEVANVAAYAVSPQGDDLTVTSVGMQSAQVGGAIKAVEENGIVAQKDTIEISNTNEAAQKIKEQLSDIRASKANAIHETLQNLEEHDKEVNERQSFMIESNASLTLSNPDYLSEDIKTPEIMKEAAEAASGISIEEETEIK